jgi:hypothetical protein
MANKLNKIKKKEFKTKKMAILLVERLKENPFLIEEIGEELMYLRIEVNNSRPIHRFRRRILVQDGKYRLANSQSRIPSSKLS